MFWECGSCAWRILNTRVRDVIPMHPTEQGKKTRGPLPSIESWFFDRDPYYFMVYFQIIPKKITGSENFIPNNNPPKPTQKRGPYFKSWTLNEPAKNPPPQPPALVWQKKVTCEAGRSTKLAPLISATFTTFSWVLALINPPTPKVPPKIRSYDQGVFDHWFPVIRPKLRGGLMKRSPRNQHLVWIYAWKGWLADFWRLVSILEKNSGFDTKTSQKKRCKT